MISFEEAAKNIQELAKIANLYFKDFGMIREEWEEIWCSLNAKKKD